MLKKLSKYIISLCLSITYAATASADIPLTAFVHDPVIDWVSISPDGKRLAALTIPPGDLYASPEITVWDLTDLSKAPKRSKPKDSKIIYMEWVGNDRIFTVGRQLYDFKGVFYLDGGKKTNGKWFRNKWYLYSADKNKFEVPKIKGLDPRFGQPGLFDRLPNEVGSILISEGSKIKKVDLKTLRTSSYFRIPERHSVGTDSFGQIREMTTVTGNGKGAKIQYSFRPDEGSWQEHFTFDALTRRGLQSAGFTNDPNVIYVSDTRQGNTSVIRTYNLTTKQTGPILFSDDKYDIGGVLQSSRGADTGKLLGYTIRGPKTKRVYTDPMWRSLQAGIDNALPAGLSNSVIDYSDDFKYVIIQSSGPKEPGAFYLMVDKARMLPLGRKYPTLKANVLADMKYVEYKARDGMTIPAFLSKPKGAGPFPAVVLPHGGPWSRDSIRFDPWVQFLTDKGYAVLQPNYRGSDGFGMDLWLAGDQEWGKKMQDDKDDGARWLVEQGIAVKDRMAIFGYSYGGYAAMAAAVRPNSPFQCAIAGAGVAELATFKKKVGGSTFGKGFQEWTIDGLSPLHEAENASIPILIMHGSRDLRVPTEQSRKYYKALKKAGKNVQYVEIKDMWHSNPWFPQQKTEFLTHLSDYLEKDCGPGGI